MRPSSAELCNRQSFLRATAIAAASGPALLGPSSPSSPVRSPASRPLPTPPEVPNSLPSTLPARMGDLVTQARKLADMVLIDSAPMLLANDAMDLIPFADTVLVVSYAGRATSEQAQQASELLARTRAPVIGVALVGVTGRSYRNLMSYSNGPREDLIAMDLSQRPSP